MLDCARLQQFHHLIHHFFILLHLGTHFTDEQTFEADQSIYPSWFVESSAELHQHLGEISLLDLADPRVGDDVSTFWKK